MTTLRPLIERFWEKVDRRGPDDCWLWTAATSRDGYGRVGVGGREGGSQRAHRVSWELHYGRAPGGLCVLHNCPGGDNPLCVNPSHLWLGTNDENMADMKRKGRARNGSAGRTHCPRGHEYSGANLYVSTDAAGTTRRSCRECKRVQWREWHRRRLLRLRAVA
jgi:HNH endonuclease